MKRLLEAVALVVMFGMSAAAAHAQIAVTDDDGRTVTLAQPATRIVSLAPHATEILFAIGAGERIVGTISYSDYPEAASKIPRIGSDKAADMERIRTLAPDLVVAWKSGNAQKQVEKLRELGIPVFATEPTTIPEVATAMERLGALTGHGAQAKAVASAFRERYAHLQATYAQRAPVRMFYQVWDHPLMTINGREVISDAMRACGAVNVFADLPALVPTVDVEAVLAADPEVIAASGHRADSGVWLEEWKRWPSLLAVARQNLVLLPPDLLNRMGPRIVLGTEQLCEAVDAARRKRG